MKYFVSHSECFCLQNVIAECGNEIEPLIFMMRCQIFIEKRNIQNFKLVYFLEISSKQVILETNILKFEYLNSPTKKQQFYVIDIISFYF